MGFGETRITGQESTLDTQLNTADTQGDEGELFRHLLYGEHLSAQQEAAIRAEDDHGVIYVDGEATEVEFWGLGDVVDTVGEVAGDAVGKVKDVVEDVADGVKAVGGYLGGGIAGLRRLIAVSLKMAPIGLGAV